MRQIEFLADEEGDWAFHCHKSHHTMNAMGHDVPTLIGVDHSNVAKQITDLIPDYMVMSERGMADMTEMEMPLPDNTAPMMTGDGPFGSIEMGGMLSIVKVRKDQQPDDYSDPGWYDHPDGTVSFEYAGEVPAVSRSTGTTGQTMPRVNDNGTQVSITRIKKATVAPNLPPTMRALSHMNNIRLSPSQTSEVLHSIPQGEIVSIIKRSGNWMQVQSRGVTGFISANLLEAL